MADRQVTNEIARTPDEIAQAARAADEGDGKFTVNELEELQWVLGREDTYTPPHEHEDVDVAVTVTEIRERIEWLEDQRTKFYASQRPTTADGLAYSVSTLEWVLGENDAFDHVVE